MKIKIGCHVSIAGSIDKAFDRAKKKECDTFQIFTKNPRGWKAKEFSTEEIERFHQKSKKYNLAPVVAHIAYLPNLSSQDEEKYAKSINAFETEIERCKVLGIPYLVIHSGSYKGGTFEDGYQTYVNSIRKGIEFGEGKVKILVENTGGEANSITDKFEIIERVLDDIDQPQAVGICFDTCHAFVAGYDLRTKKTVKKAIETVESTFGLENIDIIHANDAKGEVGSNLDQHEHIGKGKIGKEGFQAMINHPTLSKKPWILETPVDDDYGDKENITFLRSLVED